MHSFNLGDLLLLQKVCDFVITTLLSVYRNRYDPSVPYNDWSCRLHLLRVLQACLMTPPTEGTSPLQCAITIFKMAEQDNNLQVSTCTFGRGFYDTNHWKVQWQLQENVINLWNRNQYLFVIFITDSTLTIDFTLGKYQTVHKFMYFLFKTYE